MHYFKYLLIKRLYVLCIEIVLRILFLAIQNEFKSIVSLNEAVATYETPQQLWLQSCSQQQLLCTYKYLRNVILWFPQSTCHLQKFHLQNFIWLASIGEQDPLRQLYLTVASDDGKFQPHLYIYFCTDKVATFSNAYNTIQCKILLKKTLTNHRLQSCGKKKLG